MAATVLHILTPSSNQTPTSLIESGTDLSGHMIADFRNFPVSIYRVGPDQKCTDLTAGLLAPTDYWAVARKWLIEFTARTGLQDALAVEGYGFWWALNSIKFVPVLSDLGNFFAWVDLLSIACHKHSPSSVIIHGHHEPVIHLAKQICRDSEIRVQHDPVQAGSQPRTSVARAAGLLIARSVMGIAFLAYSLLRHPDICFFSNTNLLRSTDTDADDRALRDVYLGDVIQALRERGWRPAVVEKHGANASWKGLVARGFFFPSDIFFLLCTPRLRKLGIYRRIALKWQENWQEFRPRLVSHAHYRNCDITPLLEPSIRHEFTHGAPSVEILTKLWRRTLALWQPKLLYINCYYGRSAVPAIIAAKSLGIPTFEQQHGIITKNHNPYLVPRNLEASTRFPLCDFILVWGPFAKRLLVDEGVYSPEQVVVCGFPRMDASLDRLPPRSQIRARLDIPNDAMVAMYTSNLVALGFRDQILDGILKVSNTPGMHWIIKLHPREKARNAWEQEFARRQLESAQVIEDEIDFHSLLAACDVHASFASTTVLEAAILGIPNLGLDTPRVPDPVGYVEAGAFLPVAPDQLGTEALRILRDPEQCARLLSEQGQFANDWCVHDGHAVERIVHLIESTARRSTPPERLDHAPL